MKYKDFQKHYSYQRTNKYYKGTSKNKIKSNQLYYSNLRVAQSFYPLLNTLEVVLRNAIHRNLSLYFDDRSWICNQVNKFMSNKSLVSAGNLFLKKEIIKALNKIEGRNQNIVPGRVIAELSFGFWVAFYDKVHYRILRGSTLACFPYLPPNVKRKDVFSKLSSIRNFRNRIYHNEPICFVSSQVDFSLCLTAFDDIKEILNWIDPNIFDALQQENLVYAKNIIERERLKYH